MYSAYEYLPEGHLYEPSKEYWANSTYSKDHLQFADGPENRSESQSDL